MKRAILLVVAVLAAGCGGADGGGDTETASYNASLACGSANLCPAGQFCFNGLCAIGCQSGGDCASDQFCDLSGGVAVGSCQNKVVASCPATACPEAQECVQGVCTAKDQPQVACSTESLSDCGAEAFCIDPDDEGAQAASCYTMPRCGEGNTCPTGLFGATCNYGSDDEPLFAEKSRICLVGGCRATSDCPSDWFCVRYPANAPLGVCSPGSVGNLCVTDECLSPNVCCQVPMMGYGQCLAAEMCAEF